MVLTSKRGRIQQKIQIWLDQVVAANWTLVRSPKHAEKMLIKLIYWLLHPRGPQWNGVFLPLVQSLSISYSYSSEQFYQSTWLGWCWCISLSWNWPSSSSSKHSCVREIWDADIHFLWKFFDFPHKIKCIFLRRLQTMNIAHILRG